MNRYFLEGFEKCAFGKIEVDLKTKAARDEYKKDIRKTVAHTGIGAGAITGLLSYAKTKKITPSLLNAVTMGGAATLGGLTGAHLNMKKSFKAGKGIYTTTDKGKKKIQEKYKILNKQASESDEPLWVSIIRRIVGRSYQPEAEKSVSFGVRG